MIWEKRFGRGTTLDYNRLDDSPESVWLQTSVPPSGLDFGDAYQTIDSECQLQNKLKLYWSEHQTTQKEVTIVFIGDSVDAQLLDFACIEFKERKLKGWKAFVHSHHVINYCILPSGLKLVQIYLLRASHEADHKVIQTLQLFFEGDDSPAERDFDGTNRSALIGRLDEVKSIVHRRPDLIVMSSAYWSLHHFVGNHRAEVTPHLLPAEYVHHFVDTTSDLVFAARNAFPHSRFALHTSVEIRTSCEHGNNVGAENKRIWGKRSYVAQLNSALRYVGQQKGVELVDYEVISKAFQPSQLTADDIHPHGWFGLEMLNLYLNMVYKNA